MARAQKRNAAVMPALFVRKNFGALLNRVEREKSSLVIEKRGRPKAVLIGIANYVSLAAPEPEVLKMIGEESRVKGTDKLSSKQIDRIIHLSRSKSKSRRR